MNTFTNLSIGITIAFASLLPIHAEEINLWPNGLPEGSVKYDQQTAQSLAAKTTDERIAFVDQIGRAHV